MVLTDGEKTKAHRFEGNNLILIFPPFWDYYSPFLALPCLSAFLRERDFSVKSIDWNQLFFRERIVSGLKSVWERLQDRSFYEEQLSAIYRITFNCPTHADFLMTTAFINDSYFRPEIFRETFKDLSVEQINILDALYHLAYFAPFYGKINEKRLRELDLKGITDFADGSVLLESFKRNVADLLDASCMPVVGFSATCRDQLFVSLMCAAYLKTRYPSVLIALGGSYMPALLKKVERKRLPALFDSVDVVVQGEGETALQLLLEQRTERSFNGIEKIPNLVYHNSQNQIVETAKHWENMNSLPVPDFSDFQIMSYLAPEPILPYQSSRGCFWGKCAYCDHDQDYRCHYRTRSSEKVIDDLEQLRDRYNLNCVQFSDEAVSPALLKKLIYYRQNKNRFGNLEWMAYSRVSSVFDKDFCQQIASCGCRMLLLGVESFSQRLLTLMRKGTSLNLIRENIRALSESGVLIGIWMICGFPTQKTEEMEFDIEQVGALSSDISAVFPGLFRLEQTSDIYSAPEEFGILEYDPDNPYLFVSGNEGEKIYSKQTRAYFDSSYLPRMTSYSATHNRYILFFKGKTCRPDVQFQG